MPTIEITINDAAVRAALGRLIERAANPDGVLRLIGETLVDSTWSRFDVSKAPGGETWAPNSPVTIARKLGKKKDTYKKSGALSALGQRRLASKPPLVDTGTLRNTIRYLVHDNDLLVGSGQKQAAMMQFGGTKAQFPHLWGDIPARPFLGLSDADRAEIVKIVHDYLV